MYNLMILTSFTIFFLLFLMWVVSLCWLKLKVDIFDYYVKKENKVDAFMFITWLINLKMDLSMEIIVKDYEKVDILSSKMGNLFLQDGERTRIWS